MGHFYNEQLRALNVVEVDLDPTVLAKFSALLQSPLDPHDYCTASPPSNSDIRWLSANSLRCFRFFQAGFQQLGLARVVEPWLDLKERVMMYSGFLVMRSNCQQADLHVDWNDTNNQAFTCITPLTDHTPDFGLLYQQRDGSLASYTYRPGKALVFGERFLHSTRPGQSQEPVVLLSFTFGTDKMDYWPAIAETAAAQGNLVRLPNGTFQVHDMD